MKKIVIFVSPLIFWRCQDTPELNRHNLDSPTFETTDTIKETAVRETQEISDSSGVLNVFSADSVNW